VLAEISCNGVKVSTSAQSAEGIGSTPISNEQKENLLKLKKLKNNATGKLETRQEPVFLGAQLLNTSLSYRCKTYASF
jgi:hypothetical protein